MFEESAGGSTTTEVIEPVSTSTEGSGSDTSTFDMEAGKAELSESLFGKKEAEEGSEGAEKSAEVVAKVPDAKVEVKSPAEKAEVVEPVGAPKTWTKAAGETWATLPEAAKTEILRREEDMFKGLEGYKAKASFGDSVQSVLAPHAELLRSQNLDPVQAMNNLFGAHRILSTGTTEQRTEFLTNIARQYGVTLGAPVEAGDAPYTDPMVAALQAEVAQLKSGQAQTEQARQQEFVKEQHRVVAEFVADPANAYFDECADEIARLIRNGEATDLKEAYQKAIWLNPVTRDKEIARLSGEKQSKAEGEAAKKIADAKAALAANVTTKPKTGTAAKPLGSMDDTMEEALREIKSRN